MLERSCIEEGSGKSGIQELLDLCNRNRLIEDTYFGQQAWSFGMQQAPINMSKVLNFNKVSCKEGHNNPCLLYTSRCV